MKTLEEKPFLLTVLSVTLGFLGITLTVIGLTAILTSPQSGLPLGGDQFTRLAQLTAASSFVDIQTGSGVFLLGILILIVGSGLHQLRGWALQTVMGLLLVLVVLCAGYTLLFLGMLELPLDIGEFESLNNLILPMLCFSSFFLIYLTTVRHYFD